MLDGGFVGTEGGENWVAGDCDVCGNDCWVARLAASVGVESKGL